MIERAMKPALVTLSLVISLTFVQAAELSLNRNFTDDMVLQHGKPVTIAGSAAAGAEVTVTFAGQKKSAKANEQGAWSVELNTFDHGPANCLLWNVKPRARSMESEVMAKKLAGKKILRAVISTFRLSPPLRHSDLLLCDSECRRPDHNG